MLVKALLPGQSGDYVAQGCWLVHGQPVRTMAPHVLAVDVLVPGLSYLTFQWSKTTGLKCKFLLLFWRAAV